MNPLREKIKDKKRIVIKIGSSSLQHPQTGDLDYVKMDVLARELCNLRNQGKEWRKEYNNFPMRPLGWLSPREFIEKYKSQEESLLAI